MDTGQSSEPLEPSISDVVVDEEEEEEEVVVVETATSFVVVVVVEVVVVVVIMSLVGQISRYVEVSSNPLAGSLRSLQGHEGWEAQVSVVILLQ